MLFEICFLFLIQLTLLLSFLTFATNENFQIFNLYHWFIFKSLTFSISAQSIIALTMHQAPAFYPTNYFPKKSFDCFLLFLLVNFPDYIFLNHDLLIHYIHCSIYLFIHLIQRFNPWFNFIKVLSFVLPIRN